MIDEHRKLMAANMALNETLASCINDNLALKANIKELEMQAQDDKTEKELLVKQIESLIEKLNQDDKEPKEIEGTLYEQNGMATLD